MKKALALISVVGAMLVATSCGQNSLPSVQQPGAVPSGAPSDSPSGLPMPPARTGQFGGMNIGVDMTEVETNLIFACAKGNIPGPLVLDGQGHFDVTGTYQSNTVNTDPSGHRPVYQAHYFGSQVGDTFDLSYTYSSNGVEHEGQKHLVAKENQRMVQNLECSLDSRYLED